MLDEATTKCIWQSVATFLGGGLAGTILGHFLAIGRDVRNRKHEATKTSRTRKTQFLGFLAVWELEIVANRKIADANNVLQGVADRFDAKRLELVNQSELMDSDFQGDARHTFYGLVRVVIDMTPGGVDGEEGRQKLVNAIRDLTIFVRNN
jgi:hypothetical protein